MSNRNKEAYQQEKRKQDERNTPKTTRLIHYIPLNYKPTEIRAPNRAVPAGLGLRGKRNKTRILWKNRRVSQGESSELSWLVRVKCENGFAVREVMSMDMKCPGNRLATGVLMSLPETYPEPWPPVC